MQIFREGQLEFTFPAEPDWYVVKYDLKADPVAGTPAGFYREVILSGGVQHIQAVDFISYLPGDTKRL